MHGVGIIGWKGGVRMTMPSYGNMSWSHLYGLWGMYEVK